MDWYVYTGFGFCYLIIGGLFIKCCSVSLASKDTKIGWHHWLIWIFWPAVLLLVIVGFIYGAFEMFLQWMFKGKS
jgi:hypothetical protein